MPLADLDCLSRPVSAFLRSLYPGVRYGWLSSSLSGRAPMTRLQITRLASLRFDHERLRTMQWDLVASGDPESSHYPRLRRSVPLT